MVLPVKHRVFPTIAGMSRSRRLAVLRVVRFPHDKRGLTISNLFSEEIYLSLSHAGGDWPGYFLEARPWKTFSPHRRGLTHMIVTCMGFFSLLPQ